jgi:hypothetical protein
MSVQVTVRTTTTDGEIEVELASASFGHAEPDDLPQDRQESIDRVLEPESSMVAPGLSVQLPT